MSEVQLGDAAFWERLAKDPAALAAEVCSISLADLETTLQQHPALRAWVNAAHEVARIEEEKLKWEVNCTRAEALLAAKQESDPNTGKPKTVAVLDAEVTTDEVVLKVERELQAHRERRGALRAMADALEDRCQMLVQISAKQRREHDDYQ